MGEWLKERAESGGFDILQVFKKHLEKIFFGTKIPWVLCRSERRGIGKKHFGGKEDALRKGGGSDKMDLQGLNPHDWGRPPYRKGRRKLSFFREFLGGKHRSVGGGFFSREKNSGGGEGEIRRV